MGNKTGIIKKTNEQFLKEVYDLYGEEYTFLEEYKGSKIKIKVLHNICGTSFMTNPYSFLIGHTCKKCNHKKMSLKKTKTNEQFIIDLYNVWRNEYIALEEYKGVHEKIWFLHSKCGKKIFAQPNMLLNGYGCRDCGYKTVSRKLKSDKQTFVNKLEKKYPNAFEIIGEYLNSRTKIEIKCKICEKSFYARPSDFLSRGSCLYCEKSKAEKFISEYLNKNNMVYIQEFRFDDCKDKRTLPFDFAIFDKNNKLLYLIEYDGQGHYFPINFNGASDIDAKSQFEDVKRRDKIKTNYCKDNNINLIRIPYWDFDNIETILKEKLIF